MVSQKREWQFSNSQTQSLEDWYLTNRGFKTAVVNSVSYKKSQKGNPVNSGIKLLKRCKFPKNTKILKNRKNSEAEELNIWDEECTRTHGNRPSVRENKQSGR